MLDVHHATTEVVGNWGRILHASLRQVNDFSINSIQYKYRKIEFSATPQIPYFDDVKVT